MRSVGSDLERWGCLEHILEVSLLGVFHWSSLPPQVTPSGPLPRLQSHLQACGMPHGSLPPSACSGKHWQ